MRTQLSKMTHDEQIAEFWRRVEVQGPDDCWICSSGRNGEVHQKFMKQGAHRFAYELANGEFPRHLHVLHTCDNPRCCNPKHLYLGTYLDNSRDRVVRNRSAKGSKIAQAKLIEENVSAIKRQLRAGLSVTAIAALWGVVPMTVRRIRNGRNWGHVE